MPQPDDRAFDHLLRLCRATMPGAAGVVLATPSGRALAHERALIAAPGAIAREAARTRHAGSPTSALVSRAEGVYLVFFVPPSA